MAGYLNGKNRNGHGRARRGMRPWHRWLGLLAAVPVLVISATGLLLNHGPALRLDQQMVAADWLFSWYSLAPKEPMRAFPLAGPDSPPESWVVEWGGQVFFQGKAVGYLEGVRGAGALLGDVVVAGNGGALLLDNQGGVLEELHASLLPPGKVIRCGEREGSPVLETSQGVFLVRQWSESERIEGSGVRWFPGPAAPPPAVCDEVENTCRGEGLPLSRVVLDVHSGRIFGKLGVVLYDVAAGLFLALVGTGIALALRRMR